ncbi:MAG TPA: PspC domain-containing protein [Bacteroidales bacterium]|nr:MAG: Phage shock protein C [Bacteroidetes bacterium ADurb.Bin217]HPM12809.1 PspC domain-containing protein [Bacteroidales bacterium]
MKKTVTINVHGSMFHIDEDAYFMLQEYLHTLEKHFNVDDSAHEIMSDIEARISELIQMKIKRPEQVVTISDVQEIIKIMGTPEDFGIHTDTSTSSSKFDENQKFKRLYRDDDGRIFGGVCAGMAYYFAVDVVLIRILFILSFFIAGPLLYLAAWIIIPKAVTTSQKVEMRGEKIDVESIKARFKQGFNDVKQTSTQFVRQTWKDNKVSAFFIELSSSMLRAVLTITLLIIIAICVALFAGVSFSWIDMTSFAAIFPQGVDTFVQYLFSDATQSNLVFLGGVILISLPILLLFWGIFSLLLGFKKNTKLWGYIVFVIWFSGFCMIAFGGYGVYLDFTKREVVTHVQSFASPAKEYVIVKKGFANNFQCNYLEKNSKTIKQWACIECIEQTICAAKVDVEVKYEKQDSISVQVFTIARGKTQEIAKSRAQSLSFIPLFSDSTLVIPKYVAINPSSQWRNQTVQVFITLPLGTKYSVHEE